MSKPNGLALDVFSGFRVTRASRTEDAVWSAVQAAITEGWTVERFRREAAAAWHEELRDAQERVNKDWAKP